MRSSFPRQSPQHCLLAVLQFAPYKENLLSMNTSGAYKDLRKLPASVLNQARDVLGSGAALGVQLLHQDRVAVIASHELILPENVMVGLHGARDLIAKGLAFSPIVLEKHTWTRSKQSARLKQFYFQ